MFFRFLSLEEEEIIRTKIKMRILGVGITLQSEGSMQEKLMLIYNWEGEGGARVKK